MLHVPMQGLEKQVESLEANKREAEATLDEMRSQHQSQLNALGQNTKEETSKVAALMTKVNTHVSHNCLA